MPVTWNGDRFISALKASIKKSLLECAADLQHESVNAAPIDTGKLRESCAVDDSELDDLSIRVGYLDAVDDYSMVQHETLTFNHPRGGGPKFLENPFNRKISAYKTKIASDIKECCDDFI